MPKIKIRWRDIPYLMMQGQMLMALWPEVRAALKGLRKDAVIADFYERLEAMYRRFVK